MKHPKNEKQVVVFRVKKNTKVKKEDPNLGDGMNFRHILLMYTYQKNKSGSMPIIREEVVMKGEHAMTEWDFPFEFYI